MEDKTEWDIRLDADNKDDFIELTDIVKTDTDDDEPFLDLMSVEDTFEHEMELDEMELDELDLDDQSGDDPIAEEPEEEIAADESDDNRFSPAEAISSEQIEAALERVIEKKFAEKIESILFEVMERVIEKEIAEIRAALQKDLDNIGKV